MKKIVKVVAILVILLLINSSSFAEPLKMKINNEIKKSDFNYINKNKNIIFSEAKPGYFLKEDQGNWKTLIAESKDLLRLENQENFINNRKYFKVVYLNFEDTEDTNEFKYIDYYDRVLVKFDWGGKDRIVSLDLFEEAYNDIFITS